MRNAKKIIYIDGGLASQMSAYAFFLYLKSKGLNPEMDFVWYKRFGREKYELKKVFNINVPEYKGSFKYDVYISKNILARIFRKTKLLKVLINLGIIPKLYYTVKPPFGGNVFNIDNIPTKTFDPKEEVYFWGYWLQGAYLFKIRETLLNNFKFNTITERENIILENKIINTNSVSIHIRRGDFLKFKDVFETISLNYYKCAVKYIEQNINNPIFYIFSDDIDWCKAELKEIGLTNNNAIYVDWNKGLKSYRDMQLMSLCKNNINANSGFSSWASILNQNEDKIVIEPKFFNTEKWIRNNERPGNEFYKNNWIKIDN